MSAVQNLSDLVRQSGLPILPILLSYRARALVGVTPERLSV